MFRIKDGKIKVFAKYVPLIDGTHTIKVDKDTGSISYNSGESVVRYTFDSQTGRIEIESLLGSMGDDFKEPTRGRSWDNGRKISAGPLYETSNEISAFMEGFVFDFDYNGVASTAVAMKPFRWVGGRVCFNDAYGNGGYGSNQGKYTAVPSSGSCGTAWTDRYDSGVGQVEDVLAGYGGGAGGFMNSQTDNTMEYYANSTSIVFAYRSFRKYLSWARGLSGVFESSIGPIGASKGEVEPDGSFPDTFDAGFKFSMFNLKQ